MQQLQRLVTIKTRLGLGRSAIYSHIKKQLLPPPVKCGVRASAWPSDEIDAVIHARIAGKSDDEVREVVRDLVAARKGEIAP